MGLTVFPNFYDSWHFDDKIAESQLLISINSSIPEYWSFCIKEDAINWLINNASYPLVGKLKSGSGSHHVKLLKTKQESIKFTKNMFNKGIHPSPNLFFKAKSQLKTSKNWATFKNRFSRIPEFFMTLKNAKYFPREKGYVYFQEFIPNNGYDLKMVVVGDKVSFMVRNVRKNDFRASGGGDFFYARELVNKEIIDLVFKTSDLLKSSCMGYDIVVDNRSNKPKIVEMSYGFSHTALLDARGYWNRDAVWYDKPLNAPVDVLNNIVLNRKQLTPVLK